MLVVRAPGPVPQIPWQPGRGSLPHPAAVRDQDVPLRGLRRGHHRRCLTPSSSAKSKSVRTTRSSSRLCGSARPCSEIARTRVSSPNLGAGAASVVGRQKINFKPPRVSAASASCRVCEASASLMMTMTSRPGTSSLRSWSMLKDARSSASTTFTSLTRVASSTTRDLPIMWVPDKAMTRTSGSSSQDRTVVSS